MLSKVATSVRRPFACNFLLLLLVAYFFLYQYARISFYADPTSYFFNPSKAFAPGYSAQRQEAAAAFLGNDSNLPFKRLVKDTKPKLCIGIASIVREGVNYLDFSAGSLLEGLSDEERSQIELKFLIPHSDPARHPNWDSPWLQNMADEVLSYEGSFKNETWMQDVEGEKEHESEKSLFDFVYLLSACKGSGAEYVLMIEDDTVAAKGWYARTMEGLTSVRKKMRNMGYLDNFLYLRLFYTEKFLGWNSESNYTYISVSVLTITIPLALFLIPHGTRPKVLQPPLNILLLAFIYTPMLVALFFLSGKPSVLPISRGVHLMPKYVCCSQALVFPSSSIPGVISWLDWNRIEKTGAFQDDLLEIYADGGGRMGDWLDETEAGKDREILRWALTPSVVQHIGGKSSKISANGGWEGAGREDPRGRLWSFEFEAEGRRINRYGAGYG